MHKFPKNCNLALRPIISNLGTHSDHLSKYPEKLLSPLSQSEYAVKNTKEFAEQSKNISVSENSKSVPFIFHHCSQMYLSTMQYVQY